MIAYDPRGMNWDQYCKLMEELFAGNQLGHVAEENWRTWVDGMNGIGYFVQSGIPDHRLYKEWQDWAQAMTGIMNISQNQSSVY
jgi:hypothetical protein